MLESSWELNSVPLDNEEFGWLVEESTGLPASTPKNITTLQLPATDGLLVVDDGSPSSVTAISVWVNNPDVGVSVERLFQRVSVLQALCDQAEKLGFTHGRYTKTKYVSRVYSVACSVPEISGLGVAGVVVKLQITHEPGWMLDSALISTGLVDGVNHVRAFEGSGVLRDATLSFTGSASEVEITSLVDGSSLKLTGVNSGSKVDVARRRVSGVSGWDYGPDGFLKIAGKVTVEGVMPVLRVKITNPSGFSVRLGGHKWWR
ncbi:hypothetical protein [Arcanobacterium phocae]|uniref:hypothetical protein n=1 Tax=Arcanobacterium phocae TaxID=131112 RepID=UPI001C0F0019|nr:hypothetical protein [Arcanobacterium phocae]